MESPHQNGISGCLSVLDGGKRQPPKETRLSKIFEAAVSSDPRAAIAGLYYAEEFTSYKEVNRRANAAARVLLAMLSKRDPDIDFLSSEGNVTVAIDMKPCVELVVAILAVLKLGAAYMPVDSHSAINRVSYMLNEVKPVCILVDDSSVFHQHADTVFSNMFLVDFSKVMTLEQSVEEWQCANLSKDETVREQTLLAVIYTSGSTGTPKGVCITHAAACSRIFWQWERIPFGPEEFGCFKTSLLFVDAIVELFSQVLKLIPTVVSPKNLQANPEPFVNLLEAYSVSRLVMVPSLLRNMLFYCSITGGATRLPSMKLWVSNSESLSVELLTKFFDTFPNDKVLGNMYGGTETMADVTYELYHSHEDIASKSAEGNMSIGVPMFNNMVYIVNEDMEILPISEIGEMCIAGGHVVGGYLDSDVASNKFIDNPFSDDPTYKNMYRSGDFGRIVNGRIIYEGRRDMQVKIRGHRVNIREIEKVVQDCPEVEQTVVLCHKFSEVSTVVVANYTTQDKKRRTRVESVIMDACRKSLPTYMRPKLLHVDEIPLQSHTGKVDRVALRRLYERAFNRQSTHELSVLDEQGRKALNIIAMNLHMLPQAVPLDISFFDCGGNSVSMIATLVALRESGLHIDVDAFSTAASIQELIKQLETSIRPIPEVLHTDRYAVLPLQDVPNRELMYDILTDGFVSKEPLDILLGIKFEEFNIFTQSLRHKCENGNAGFSFLVIDQASGEVVAGDFLFDFYETEMDFQYPSSMQPIIGLFEEFEDPVTQQMSKSETGPLMLNLCLGVRKDLPDTEQVRICHLMEGHAISVAENAGYVGIITNNTNPVTQDICEHFYGYDVLSKYLVKDFVYNGCQIFKNAPDDYYIKMMMKKFKV